MKAMVFAAGLGTRLGNITRSIPKALVDINGITILELAVDKLTSAGFDDIIVNIHHFADKVLDEISILRKKGYKIAVSDERELLLDTGGGLFKARWFFDNNPFLIYNVDIITDIDLAELYRYHIDNKAFATLAVRDRPGNRFYLVDKDGRLGGWCNKATGETILAGTDRESLTEVAFCGIHILSPDAFKYMEENIFTMTSFYLKIASRERILTLKKNEGYWVDIGTVKKLEYCRRLKLK